MVKTASTMLPLGTKAPDFALLDTVSGETITLEQFQDKQALLVMFICQHCPFVRRVKAELARLGKDYADKNVGIVAISANDVENYPDDSPEKLQEMAQELDFNFPFCYDESQEVAKAYTAACTPDFFVFDRSLQLVYRGQLDDSILDESQPVDGKYIRAALDALLAGEVVDTDQKPSVGCNIKWKSGNEPAYF
ncbi:MAG: thioredoxin family protein [Oscillatoria sp. PMC 1051.18]|uniref:thioredoxin family protein n=1 Tax=Oscillatoria salina TaxID=331517 RepID=UPI0013B720E9|nr:thioredoxin family protein [Oscillatoria salina]MBZ8180171.1 thioredoxin family protein [Oscillatoria salina IIICB1]MEC4891527.1 thioredoxin family protein [Oscillatoria sp. PMC 1050.18]MEC5029689.1 thioredoxin family protein [Oscillatoria sp. PMC 1051.18]NET88592.1 thioredoxin family protein [Kamptonema sp. SIO1D9]